MRREELNVGDEVIWTSPFSGNDVRANYRGEYNGMAVLWTGVLQVSAQFKHLRRAQ